MRIGLLGDSQGDVEAVLRALEVLDRAEVERVYFLGNRCADLDAALARRREARRAGEGRVPTTDLEFLEAVQGALLRQAGGDDPLAARIVRVASRDEPAEDAASRKGMDLVEGRICTLVHDKADLTRDDIANASLLFHGGADAAALVLIGPRAFVTPGPLHAEAGGGFAMLAMDERTLALAVHRLDGKLVRVDTAPLGGAGGKLSVKG